MFDQLLTVPSSSSLVSCDWCRSRQAAWNRKWVGVIGVVTKLDHAQCKGQKGRHAKSQRNAASCGGEKKHITDCRDSQFITGGLKS